MDKEIAPLKEPGRERYHPKDPVLPRPFSREVREAGDYLMIIDSLAVAVD